MALKNKEIFFGDEDDIYEMHNLDVLSDISHGRKDSFNYDQEKDELVSYCNQILSSYKSEESTEHIILDSDSLEEVVNHLSKSEKNIVEFNINNMVELNMQEFITDIADKVCIQQYNIDFEILSNLIHLIQIWSDGTKDQISILFNQTFISYLFVVSRSFFLKDSAIVNFATDSIKNLLLKKYFPNEAIPEIMTELLLLLDQFLTKTHELNNVFLESIQNVFLCFQAVLKQEKIEKLPQIDGLIVMTKRCIDFIQETFFDEYNIFQFKSKSQKANWSPKTDKRITLNDKEEDDDDSVDYDVMCSCLCSVIQCMNDIVLINNETVNYFFDISFMKSNLISYLKTSYLELKKKALNTLELSLTIVGSDNFTALEYVKEGIWINVEKITDNEDDCDLKQILCKVINSIFRKMPTIMQIIEEKKRQKQAEEQAEEQDKDDKKQDEEQDKDDEKQDEEQKDEKVDEKNEEEEDGDDENHADREFFTGGGDDDGIVAVDEEEEDEDERSNCDSSHGFIFTPSHDYIWDLYEYGVLSRILSLSGSKEEPIIVRIEATLAIASNINIFSTPQISHLIQAGGIKVLIDSLEIFDENQIETVFDAIWKIFDYIDSRDNVELAYCVSLFDKAFADLAFEDVLKNPLFEGKLDNTVNRCIEKLGELRNRTPPEQRKKSEESLERKKMIGDDDEFAGPDEYDEYGEN